VPLLVEIVEIGEAAGEHLAGMLRIEANRWSTHPHFDPAWAIRPRAT
jgi:hypothetical protein